MAHGGVLWNKGRRTLSVRHTCRIPREMRAGFSESQHALTLFGKIPKACQNTLKGDTPCQSFHLCTCLTAPPYVTHSSAQQTQTVRDADVALHCTATEAKQNMSLVVFHLVTVLTVSGKRCCNQTHWIFTSESLSSLLKTTTHHDIIVFYKFTSMAENSLSHAFGPLWSP